MKININKVAGICVSVIGTVILGYKFLSALSDNNVLSNLTDEELDAEREKIRLDYCNPALDDNYRNNCYNKLRVYDAEIHKRMWGDKEPTGELPHREHGWYLPNDD